MNHLLFNLIFFWEISPIFSSIKRFRSNPMSIIAWTSCIFSLENVFSRSAFWSLIFPSLTLYSAIFKLDFWLLISSSSSSIFCVWVCNTSCSFFFISCSSFSLDWISFCISRSATYLLWAFFYRRNKLSRNWKICNSTNATNLIFHKTQRL